MKIDNEATFAKLGVIVEAMMADGRYSDASRNWWKGLRAEMVVSGQLSSLRMYKSVDMQLRLVESGAELTQNMDRMVESGEIVTLYPELTRAKMSGYGSGQKADATLITKDGLPIYCKVPEKYSPAAVALAGSKPTVQVSGKLYSAVSRAGNKYYMLKSIKMFVVNPMNHKVGSFLVENDLDLDGWASGALARRNKRAKYETYNVGYFDASGELDIHTFIRPHGATVTGVLDMLRRQGLLDGATDMFKARVEAWCSDPTIGNTMTILVDDCEFLDDAPKHQVIFGNARITDRTYREEYEAEELVNLTR